MALFCSRCGKPARETAKFCQACGAPFVQILQAGSTLDRGRYEVLKPLILYRDLKPSNILLRKDDERLFLIDFGIAKRVQSALTHSTSWDTEGYAPIEQCQGEPEVRSDIYALGATMHYLLSGRPPVPFKFPAIRSLHPEVSVEMEAVLEKALKLHAHERYQSAREMREALEGIGCLKLGEKSKSLYSHQQKVTTTENNSCQNICDINIRSKPLYSPA